MAWGLHALNVVLISDVWIVRAILPNFVKYNYISFFALKKKVPLKNTSYDAVERFD